MYICMYVCTYVCMYVGGGGSRLFRVNRVNRVNRREMDLGVDVGR